MIDFKKELDKLLNAAEQEQGNPIRRLEFISDYIFDFATYDTSVAVRLAKNMIEVLDVIINDKNFKYIEDDSNYLKYITMCNTTFLADKIGWGTSIRGAWLQIDKPYKMLNGFSLYEGEFKVKPEDFKEFIRQLIEWSAD